MTDMFEEAGRDPDRPADFDETFRRWWAPMLRSTFTVTGGTVTVDVENGTVSLVSVTPAAGFSVDKSESRGDRVEVELRNGDVQSRVRVRFDDGRLRVESGDH